MEGNKQVFVDFNSLMTKGGHYLTPDNCEVWQSKFIEMYENAGYTVRHHFFS